MKHAALLFALLSAAPAIAQTRSRRIPNPTSVPAPTQRLDISEGDTVEGGVASGDGTVSTSMIRRKKPSLIQPRADFLPEMLRSAEDL